MANQRSELQRQADHEATVGLRLPVFVALAAGWVALIAGIAAAGAGALALWSLPAFVVAGALFTAAAILLAGRLLRLADALAASRETQQKFAATDALTGTLNRTAFMVTLERDLQRCQRYSEPLVLIALDIDFFKRINGGYGHAVGDDVLRRFAVALSQGLRNVDAIGRVGGGEFAILLPNTELDPAMILAERLRERVAAIVVKTPADEDVRFTTSAGVVQLDAADKSADAMLRRADAALVRAKELGRNRVEAGIVPG